MALVPGCHCIALRSNTGLCHLPLPVVWSPKVGGGIAVVLQLVPTERNWAAGKRKVGERERRLPPCVGPRLCSPPAEMLPAQLSAAHQVLLKSQQMGNLSENQQGAKRKQFSLLSRFFYLTNLMFLKNAHYKRLQPKILTLLKMELRRACDVNGSV